jgi:hypothetical protein
MIRLAVLVALLGVAPEPVVREEVARRLVQLDVSLRGPDEILRGLDVDDFELIVGGARIEHLYLDRICDREPVRDATERDLVDARAPAASKALRPVTFLFYFDQPFLTMTGRNQALEMARRMIPDLVRDGHRAIVMSSGDRLTAFAELTDDAEKLLAGIARMYRAPGHWDPIVMEEEERIDEVLNLVTNGQTNQAQATANRYRSEERWRAERALQRLSMTVSWLGRLDPPKVVIYFADRLRSHPGNHYVSLLPDAPLAAMDLDAALGRQAFDHVVEEASAQGVRIYAVQAEGLQSLARPNVSTSRREVNASQHLIDASGSLGTLARITGGRKLLGGDSSTRIVQAIRDDLACVYLLSFDAEGLPEGEPLRVLLRVRKPGVELHVREQVFIQSASQRLASRLLAAFAKPELAHAELSVGGVLIPTGFRDGRYTALVQLLVPPTAAAPVAWDIGASLVSRDQVREDFARRVAFDRPATLLVLETEMAFKPGPFELAVVAHETTRNLLGTGRLSGAWPDPDDAAALVGPIAVVQPAPAVFVRGSEQRTEGALGRRTGEPLLPDRPAVLVSLVCRGRGRDGPLEARRWLTGDSTVEFPFMELDLLSERCAQIRDVIPENTLTAGAFRYGVQVSRASETLATVTLDLAVVDAERK